MVSALRLTLQLKQPLRLWLHPPLNSSLEVQTAQVRLSEWVQCAQGTVEALLNPLPGRLLWLFSSKPQLHRQAG